MCHSRPREVYNRLFAPTCCQRISCKSRRLGTLRQERRTAEPGGMGKERAGIRGAEKRGHFELRRRTFPVGQVFPSSRRRKNARLLTPPCQFRISEDKIVTVLCRKRDFRPARAGTSSDSPQIVPTRLTEVSGRNPPCWAFSFPG
jgi:hypothetical protein